ERHPGRTARGRRRRRSLRRRQRRRDPGARLRPHPRRRDDRRVEPAGRGGDSEVSLTWLADAVRSGEIRWVLTDGTGGGFGGNDGRTGSTTAMNAVAQTCTPVTTSSSSTTTASGLYDCQGRADAI